MDGLGKDLLLSFHVCTVLMNNFLYKISGKIPALGTNLQVSVLGKDFNGTDTKHCYEVSGIQTLDL